MEVTLLSCNGWCAVYKNGVRLSVFEIDPDQLSATFTTLNIIHDVRTVPAIPAYKNFPETIPVPQR